MFNQPQQPYSDYLRDQTSKQAMQAPGELAGGAIGYQADREPTRLARIAMELPTLLQWIDATREHLAQIGIALAGNPLLPPPAPTGTSKDANGPRPVSGLLDEIEGCFLTAGQGMATISQQLQQLSRLVGR